MTRWSRRLDAFGWRWLGRYVRWLDRVAQSPREGTRSARERHGPWVLALASMTAEVAIVTYALPTLMVAASAVEGDPAGLLLWLAFFFGGLAFAMVIFLDNLMADALTRHAGDRLSRVESQLGRWLLIVGFAVYAGVDSRVGGQVSVGSLAVFVILCLGPYWWSSTMREFLPVEPLRSAFEHAGAPVFPRRLRRVTTQRIDESQAAAVPHSVVVWNRPDGGLPWEHEVEVWSVPSELDQAIAASRVFQVWLLDRRRPGSQCTRYGREPLSTFPLDDHDKEALHHVVHAGRLLHEQLDLIAAQSGLAPCQVRDVIDGRRGDVAVDPCDVERVRSSIAILDRRVLEALGLPRLAQHVTHKVRFVTADSLFLVDRRSERRILRALFRLNKQMYRLRSEP